MKIKSKSLLHILFISLAVIAVVFVGLPANAAAADAWVHAVSPVSEIVQGNNVTFDWYLDHTSNAQTKFILHTSAGTRTVYTPVTEYKYEDFPHGYGWWYVVVYKSGSFGEYKYGKTTPKSFYFSPNEPEKPKYLPVYDSKGEIVFFEVQRDYTINLSKYFDEAANGDRKFPTNREVYFFQSRDASFHNASFYRDWAANDLRDFDGDFIRLDEGGILTIKQGYRWDGASFPCKDRTVGRPCIDATFNIRSSLVHDALYDLMRMGYLEPDMSSLETLDTNDKTGDRNRQMADMMYYMIAVEEGQPEDNFPTVWPLRGNGAQNDYMALRSLGAAASHDDKRLAGWKYHVSELTADASDGKVELEWKPADAAGKDPKILEQSLEQFGIPLIHNGYMILRDDVPIGNVSNSTTSYVDNNVTDGNTYSYQIVPHPDNTNKIVLQLGTMVLQLDNPNHYDWSNTVQAPTVDAGPDATINEGDTFTNSGSFTDPGADTWTATVDYGEGSGDQPLTLTGKNFSLSHVYADNGVYTVRVTVTDDDGGVGTDTAQVTVNNVSPTVNVVPLQSKPGEDTFTNSGSFTDPGADTWTATVDYGEGSGDQPLTLTGKNFSLSHVYADNGVYTVRVTVTDDDGGVGTDTLTTVVVTNVPYNPYDKNKDYVIDIGEVNAAIDDYRTQGPTSIAELSELIDLYRSGEPYC